MDNYSNALKSKTREILNEQSITFDLKYHLKHQIKGFATLDFFDLRENRFIIKDLKNDEIIEFLDIEALIDAGWVID